jgi:hypothetical protein
VDNKQNYNEDKRTSIMGYKTRSVYNTGAKECGPNCQCLFCKRKRKLDKQCNWLEYPDEARDFIGEYFSMHKKEKKK